MSARVAFSSPLEVCFEAGRGVRPRGVFSWSPSGRCVYCHPQGHAGGLTLRGAGKPEKGTQAFPAVLAAASSSPGCLASLDTPALCSVMSLPKTEAPWGRRQGPLNNTCRTPGCALVKEVPWPVSFSRSAATKRTEPMALFLAPALPAGESEDRRSPSHIRLRLSSRLQPRPSFPEPPKEGPWDSRRHPYGEHLSSASAASSETWQTNAHAEDAVS